MRTRTMTMEATATTPEAATTMTPESYNDDFCGCNDDSSNQGNDSRGYNDDS